VYKALAGQFGMTFLVDIEDSVNLDSMNDVSFDVFKDAQCLPLGRDDMVLRAAVSDPLDIDAILQVEAATGLVVEASITPPSKMSAARHKLFESSSLLKESMGKISREYEKQSQGDDTLSVEEIKKRTESEPVVKMASLIFNEAIKRNASDIHIEPPNTRVVRYRIDRHAPPGTWTWRETCTCRSRRASRSWQTSILPKSACRRTAVSGTTIMGGVRFPCVNFAYPPRAKKP